MAVIDLRGGNQNPWAQFLPQLFQKMAIGKLENKFALEQLKAKAIQDADIKTKDRAYQEQQDIEKFNRELEGKRSEAAINRQYAKPEKPSIIEIMDPQTKTPSAFEVTYQNGRAVLGKKLGDKPETLDSVPSVQRRTRYIERNGKVFAQEYNFNPKTQEEKTIGKEYQSKVPGEITIQQSIPAKVAEQNAKDLAKQKMEVQSPKFRDTVIQSVKTGKGMDWDIIGEPEKKLEIRKEADRRMRDIYGEDIVWDIKNGALGWYKNGKLIRRWSD